MEQAAYDRWQLLKRQDTSRPALALFIAASFAINAPAAIASWTYGTRPF